MAAHQGWSRRRLTQGSESEDAGRGDTRRAANLAHEVNLTQRRLHSCVKPPPRARRAGVLTMSAVRTSPRALLAPAGRRLAADMYEYLESLQREARDRKSDARLVARMTVDDLRDRVLHLMQAERSMKRELREKEVLLMRAAAQKQRAEASRGEEEKPACCVATQAVAVAKSRGQ